MQLLDARGQAVRAETLPPETQAQVERVRKAAESLAGGADGMQRIKITVRCSWPPLKCSIDIQF